MKKILEYLPLLSVCLLYFGFCSMYGYYNEFNIEITSFISTQDILLSFFPTIILFSSTLSATIFQQLYSDLQNTSTMQQNQSGLEAFRNKVKAWANKNGYYFVIFYYIFVSLIAIIINAIFHFKPYTLKDYNLFTDFLFLFLLYIVIMMSDRRDIITRNTVILSLFLIVFIGMKIQGYRRIDALRAKDGKNEKVNSISFTYNMKNISTSDSIILIGQTSNWIFLYHTKDSSTFAYSISKIDNLKVK